MKGDRLRVAFDVGGVISRYPEDMKELMYALRKGGCEVFILTDMNQRDAMAAIEANGLLGFAGANTNSRYADYVLSADWSANGYMSKSVVMAEHNIDILIDDRPDCCHAGNFIGMVLAPRPDKPYYAPGWVNRSTPAACVPPEEYEAFKAWKAEREEKPA